MAVELSDWSRALLVKLVALPDLSLQQPRVATRFASLSDLSVPAPGRPQARADTCVVGACRLLLSHRRQVRCTFVSAQLDTAPIVETDRLEFVYAGFADAFATASDHALPARMVLTNRPLRIERTLALIESRCAERPARLLRRMGHR